MINDKKIPTSLEDSASKAPQITEKQWSEGVYKNNHKVEEAKNQQKVDIINAVTRMLVSMIEKFLPIILVFVMCAVIIMIIILLGTYTLHLIINVNRLETFLIEAWKAIQDGAPFTLLFILLSWKRK